MVLINCYYYIINVDLNKIDTRYTLKPLNFKINGEIVYDLIDLKNVEDYIFGLKLF